MGKELEKQREKEENKTNTEFEDEEKEIIIKMLKENYEDDIIIKLTEIDKEELEKLKEEVKNEMLYKCK